MGYYVKRLMEIGSISEEQARRAEDMMLDAHRTLDGLPLSTFKFYANKVK